MELDDWLQQYDYKSDEDDDYDFYWGEGDDYNYCMSTEESESDGDEGDRKGMPQVGTGINDATILGDEKQISEVSGTGMCTQLNFYDGEPMEEDKSATIKATDGDALEEDMSAEKKKKMEKRKSREDWVESKQNDGGETAIEMKKKKKKSSDVNLKDNYRGYWVGTTGLGFVLDSCVILGSDKEKGYPSGKEKRLTKKTFQLSSLPIGYVRVGVAVDAKILIEELKNCAKSGSTDITEMPDYILSRAPVGLAGQLLIGGYSQGSVEPHLYCISKHGVLDLTAENGILELRNRFHTGSGRGAAFVILNDRYRRNMTEADGKVLMEDCIYNSIKNDRYTEQGIEYIVIKPGQDPEIERMTLEQYESRKRGPAV